MKKSILALALPLAICAATFTGCEKKESSKGPSVAVFVPGIMADSPTYANFAAGVQDGIDEYNAKISDERMKAKIHVMEAGTNQAEWATQLTALVANGTYDVIISSNPSLPEMAAELTNQFPNQKFLMMDGALEGNKNIACVSYDQKEQTYLCGYISGLMSKSHKVAVVAAQEYPVMNNVLYPYYALGAADAFPGTTCDFRIVGNWYDASKGSEITDALISQGVDVILPICGGASQGVLASAVEHGIYLTFIDENSYAKAAGTVIASVATKQRFAAKETITNFLNGKTDWGKTRYVGITDGYIEYIQDDPIYKESVPAEIRNKMSELIDEIVSGKKNSSVTIGKIGIK